MEGEYYHTKESVDEYISLARDVSGLDLIIEMKKVLPQGSSLLELGSGPGTDWKILNEEYKVTGSDYSQEFLDHLNSKYPSGNFLQLDASTLLTNSIFDGIYSNKVLHHLTDKQLEQSVIKQAEILSNDGIVCHSFWKGDGSETFKGMFVNYHMSESLQSLFSSSFEILSLSEYKEFEDNDSILLIARRNQANIG